MRIFLLALVLSSCNNKTMHVTCRRNGVVLFEKQTAESINPSSFVGAEDVTCTVSK